MIKYILTLLSFLLCSCGGTDSPSITKTTQQVAIAPTPEITGPFVEISNAFPDVDLWFNWTDPNNNPPFNAGVQLAAAVDLDNDGKKELVLILAKTFSGAIQGTNPSRSKIVILKLNSQSQFVDATESFIKGENSIPGLSGHDIVVADLNNDGKKDIVFNFNQDAGGVDVRAPYNGFGVLLSGLDGTYKIVLANQSNGVQDVAVGYDSLGEPFIFPAGSGINVDVTPNLPYKIKNNQIGRAHV